MLRFVVVGTMMMKKKTCPLLSSSYSSFFFPLAFLPFLGFPSGCSIDDDRQRSTKKSKSAHNNSSANQDAPNNFSHVTFFFFLGHALSFFTPPLPLIQDPRNWLLFPPGDRYVIFNDTSCWPFESQEAQRYPNGQNDSDSLATYDTSALEYIPGLILFFFFFFLFLIPHSLLNSTKADKASGKQSVKRFNTFPIAIDPTCSLCTFQIRFQAIRPSSGYKLLPSPPNSNDNCFENARARRLRNTTPGRVSVDREAKAKHHSTRCSPNFLLSFYPI